MRLARTLDVYSSLFASTLRGWRGTQSFRPAKKQPEKPAPQPRGQEELLRARPIMGEIDHDALTREIIAKFPKILAALEKS